MLCLYGRWEDSCLHWQEPHTYITLPTEIPLLAWLLKELIWHINAAVCNISTWPCSHDSLLQRPQAAILLVSQATLAAEPGQWLVRLASYRFRLHHIACSVPFHNGEWFASRCWCHGDKFHHHHINQGIARLQLDIIMPNKNIALQPVYTRH